MAEFLRRRLFRFRHQGVLQEIEGGGVNIRIGTPGARHRPGDVAAVSVGRHTRKVEIGAVDRKVRDDLSDRALEERARQIRRHRALIGQLRGVAPERVKLARHFVFHDPQFAIARDCREILAFSGDVAIGLREGLLAAGIHQHAEREICVVVARRALDRPFGPQSLVGRQDLLDDQIKRLGRARPQRAEIGFGIEETVDMIDAQPIDFAAFEHAEYARVDMVKDRAHFDTQSREVVDIEEAAVVDLVFGHPMKGDAPELLPDETIEFAPVAVERINARVDRRSDAALLVGKRGELGFERPGSLRQLRAPLGEVEKEVGHPIERRVLMTKNPRKGQRVDRQFVIVISPNGETPVGFEAELELARFQLLTILRAKHGRQELAVLGRPVDVEPARISRIGTPLENVEPQRIV
jgi:hypothetical protein